MTAVRHQEAQTPARGRAGGAVQARLVYDALHVRHTPLLAAPATSAAITCCRAASYQGKCSAELVQIKETSCNLLATCCCRTIYNMCTQKPPHDYSEQLYERYKESFNTYITERVGAGTRSNVLPASKALSTAESGRSTPTAACYALIPGLRNVSAGAASSEITQR